GRGAVRGGDGGGAFVPHPRGHLVAAAACGRADRGGRPRGVGAVLAHRLDQGGDDPGGGPRAARVGGADDPGGGVGEQDGRAVGDEDGEGKAGNGRDDRVDRLGQAGGVGERDVGAVHLPHEDDAAGVDA